MKSITKRIISTLAICGALVLEAGATAIGSLGKALNNIAEVKAETSYIDFSSPISGFGYDKGTQNNLQYEKDDVTLTASSISGKNGSCIQLVKSGTITSTAFPGTILSVYIADCKTTSSKTDGGFKVEGSKNGSTFSTVKEVTGLSSSDNPQTINFTESDGYKYFKITNGSARVLLTSDIKVTYKVESSKSLSSIAVKTAPSKITYESGEHFDPAGLVLTATYSDTSTEDISYAEHSSDFSFSPSLTTGLTSSGNMTITYGGKSTTQAYTVTAPITDWAFKDLTISAGTAKTSYSVGESFDNSGFVVTLIEHSNTAGKDRETVVVPSGFTGFDSSKVGTCNVKATYSYGGSSKTTSNSVTVSIVNLVSDVIDNAFTGVGDQTGSTIKYTAWSGKTGSSSVVYAGCSAGDKASVQLRSKNSDSAIYTTSNEDGIFARKVIVDWNSGTSAGAQLDVYGKNTAYSEAADLYGTDKGTKIGSIVNGTSTQLEITDDYAFIGLRSNSGALYINSITIQWEPAAEVALESIEVTTSPTNLQYSGKALDKTGMVVTATYDDGSTADVTSSVSFDPATLTSKTTKVTVSYTEDDVTATTDLTIDVLTLNKITATGYKTAFRAGESFSFGGTVYPWYTHSDGSAESQGTALSSTDYTVSKSGTLSKGDDQEVTVSHGGKDFTYTIDVGYAYVTGITMSPTAEVGVGGEVTFSATVAPETADQSVTYAVDTTETTLDPSEYSLNGNKLTIADEIAASGKVFVTATTNDVTSGGEHKTTSCQVTVTKAVIAQITEVKVTGAVTHTEQYVGKAFNYEGLEFTPVWSEGEHDVVTITGADIQWPALTDGMTKITGKYITSSSTLDVVVSGFAVVDDYLDSITVSGDLTTKTYYSNSEDWNYAGLSVTGVNASGDPATITESGIEYTANKTPAEYYSEGLDKLVVTATYGGKSNTKEITGIVVNEFKLNKLEVTTAPKTSYILGEDFISEGMVVKATYSDGSHNDNFTSYTLDTDNINKFAEGTYKVDVKVGDTTYTSIDVTYAKKQTQEGYDYWQKVTSTPTDWSGEYLLVYESESTAHVWTGVDAALCYATAAISSNKIETKPDGTVSVVIAKMSDGYSVKVNGGTNDGKYLYGNSTSNKLNFSDSVSLNTISYDSDCTQIVSNSATLQFNKSSNEMRFRYYYKSGQQGIQLYKHVEQEAITASLIKIEATCDKTFKEDDTLKISDLTITSLFDDLKEHDLPEAVKFAGGSTEVKLTGGNNVLTVKCGDISTSITVYATPKVPVSSVAIGNKPANDKLYYYGDFVDEHQFSVTVLPEDAADKSVTWSITDGDALASIDQTGKVTVTGAGAGSVTIQAKAGDKTDSYTFSVVLDTVSSIAVTEAPDQVEYYAGEAIDLAGIEITATMTSGKTHDFAYDDGAAITCTKEKAALGDTSITIEFDEKQTTTPISVHEPYVTDIKAVPQAINIAYGSNIKDSSLVITAYYEDGSSKTVDDYTVDESFDNTYYEKPQDVDITYGGKTITISVQVLEPKINFIDVEETSVEVPYGRDLEDYIHVNIKTEDDDNPRPYYDYDIENFVNTDKSGVQQVRITAGEGVYDTVFVTVTNSIDIDEITSVSGPTIVDYGTSISPSDFTVNVTYTDGLPGTIIPTSIDGYDPETVGAQTVTLYKDDEEITDVTVTVSPSTVVDYIVIVSGKEEVAYGGTLTTDDFLVKAVYTDGHYDEEASHPDSISGFDGSLRGEQEVTVTFKGKSEVTTVKVLDSTVIDSLVVTSHSDNLTYGSSYSVDDIVLSVTYTDGRTVNNMHPDSISGFTGAPGENTVHYIIANKEGDVKVTVLPSTVIGSITASTEKTEVAFDGSFTAADVSVTYVYTDGHTLIGQAAESISGFDPKHVGAQTITVTAAGKETTITVTVLPSTIVDYIEVDPTAKTLAYGEPLGAYTVKAVYTDDAYVTGGHKVDVTSACVIGEFDGTPGNHALSIKYNDGSKDHTCSLNYVVKESTIVDHIEATANKNNLEFNSEFTKDDVTVTYVYTDGHKVGGQAAESISGYKANHSGEQDVTVMAIGKSTTIKVTVKELPEDTDVKVKTETVEVEYNAQVDSNDIKLNITFPDGHVEEVGADSLEGFDPTKVGEQEVVAKVGGKSVTFRMIVKASEVVDHIEVEVLKPEVQLGYNFTKDDVKVTFFYTDGHTSFGPADVIEGFNKEALGAQEVTVIAKGHQAKITVTVTNHYVTSLEVTGYTENVDQGKEYVFDGKVIAHYADETSAEVTDYTITKVNTEGHGPQKATVSYGGLSVEITINVIQTKTPLEPTAIVGIVGGSVVGVSALAVGLYFLLKSFKLKM